MRRRSAGVGTTRTRPTRWIAALTGALLLLVLGTALAGGAGLKTAKDTETADGGGTAETTARCDGKTKAVSGGFENEFDAAKVVMGGSPQPSQYRSYRVGKRRWTGSTYNLGSVPGDVTTFVYCGRERLEERTEFETVVGTPFMSGDYSTGRVTAKCPGDSKPVSGGFDNSDFIVEGDYNGDTRIITYVSRRQGSRRWIVEGANYAGDDGSLGASVYCHEGRALGKKRKRMTFTAAPGEVAVREAVAKCPKGDKVVSGGFGLHGPGATVLSSRKRGGRKWAVSAAVGYPETAKLTAFAYCDKHK